MDREPQSNQYSNIIQIGGSDGKLSFYKYPNKKNNNGENEITHKTSIFRGLFENRTSVCVRQFEKLSIINNSDPPKKLQKDEAIKQIKRDIDALRKPQNLHENFIRYWCTEEDEDFVYVATEWCICSVEDLYDSNRNGKNWAGETINMDIIKQSLGEKELLRQATKGLAHLHELDFVHRNLKPSNFLIAQLQQASSACGFRYLVKLSDFRMSKNPVKCPEVSETIGSNGWTYPKPPKGTKADASIYFSGDVFILGCLFHYVLTNGQHPFGRYKSDRELNIKNPGYDVYLDEWDPINIKDKQAVVLLKDMIKFDLNKICAMHDISKFHYFLPQNYYKLYDLPDVKPGLCVIFNQEKFHRKDKERHGSSKDKESLKDVFIDFGFDVKIFENQEEKELHKRIDELTNQDFSSYASFVVCILSHGAEEVVFGIDGNKININKLKYKFNSNDCPTLNGKPKIWIIQACQGDGCQEPIQTQPNDSKASAASSKSDSGGESVLQQNHNAGFNEMPVSLGEQKVEKPTSCSTSESTLFDDLNKRPPLMDFLDVRSCIPEYVSYRNTKDGSFLIKYLCEELKKEYLTNNTSPQEKKSLEDILKNVQNHINSIVIESTISPNTEDIEVKQTIEWRASLSNRIVFKKAKTPGTVIELHYDCISEHQSENYFLTDLWLSLTNWFQNVISWLY